MEEIENEGKFRPHYTLGDRIQALILFHGLRKLAGLADLLIDFEEGNRRTEDIKYKDILEAIRLERERKHSLVYLCPGYM
jgi:hypothetical protein